METTLQPIIQHDTLHREIEEELKAYLMESLFKPLIDLFEEAEYPVERLNARTSSVMEAIKNRQIWYLDGVFSGQFKATISRELRQMGARWDSRTRTFSLPIGQTPIEIRQAAAQTQIEARRLQQRILDTLKQVEGNLPKSQAGLQLELPLNKTLENLDRQFRATTSKIGVRPDLTPAVKARITREYTENMDKLIKKFATKRIPVLRKQIQDLIFEGARPDKLFKVIQAEYGVSGRKAAFLAEQEHSLLVSKYRESRYRELGSTRYVWRTSRDSRVRHDHEELNGKVFYWDQPPVTNRHTGERNNPGEDFNCRCVAVPILDIQED